MTNKKYEKITSDDFDDGVFTIGNNLIVDDVYYHIRINDEEHEQIVNIDGSEHITYDYLNNAYVIVNINYNHYLKYHKNIIKEVKKMKEYCLEEEYNYILSLKD